MSDYESVSDQELQMDQQAKKHLQEEFDATLEEKDQMITVLHTQVCVPCCLCGLCLSVLSCGDI